MGCRAVSCENDAVTPPQQSCSCGYRTLFERGGFEICPVCFWEDDVDAQVDRGGPNRGTLWQARTNYLKLAVSEERAKERVRSVVVWCSGGVPRIRCARLALRFDRRTSLALAALDDCARRYWDAWDLRRPGCNSPNGGDA